MQLIPAKFFKFIILVRLVLEFYSHLEGRFKVILTLSLMINQVRGQPI